jgi:hypothetical protein
MISSLNIHGPPGAYPGRKGSKKFAFWIDEGKDLQVVFCNKGLFLFGRRKKQ